MSNTVFAGKKAAFLVENGFCEREFTQAQTALNSLGITTRIISAQPELLSAWNEAPKSSGSDWGMNYAPDAVLSQAQPSDYDILVIPGGKRSIEKMKLGVDVRAFMSGFVLTGKPVIVYNAGHDLFEYFDLPDFMLPSSAPKMFSVSKNIISIYSHGENGDAICNAVLKILGGVALTKSSNEQAALKIISSEKHKAA